MDNNTTVNVNVDPSNSFASPAPVLTLIFATLCFCFWANTMGFFTEGAVLAIGVLQLGVFVAYTVGGIIMLGWCGIELTQGKPFFIPK